MKSTFHRFSGYTKAIDDVKEFCDVYGKDILPVPGEAGIICYYHGLPVVEINDSSWKKFGTEYNKYFADAKLCAALATRSKNDIRDVYLKNSNTIKNAFKKALPRDKERFSQQDIIMRTLCDYWNEGYVVCGMETAVPLAISNSEKIKPEIDIVAINPESKKILLIEYKCQKSALLNKKGKDIVSHCKDYQTIKNWIDSDTDERSFINGMIGAYNTMLKIFGYPICCDLKAKDFSVETVFLLTNHPSVGKDVAKGKSNLTKQSYINAVNNLREKVRESADGAYYVAYNRPEDILTFPTDIISEKYKGTDKLVWRWK